MSKRDDRADAKRLRVEVAEETAASERLKATYGGSFCAVEDYLRHSDAAADKSVLRHTRLWGWDNGLITA